MAKLKHFSIMLVGCLAIGGSVAEVAAQTPGWDRGRNEGWEQRGRDDDDDDDRDVRRRDRGEDRDRDVRGQGRDRDGRGRDGRGRERDGREFDRDGDRDRRWGGRDRDWRDGDRGRNCYVVRRRMVEPDGDVIIRRSRVCED